ncbi:L-threonine dehydrogenase [Capsaspora owczarzaki ATCC 30864]|uniref:L-threonine 3-dehydrogenase, mitochondrial n=1 Tax=Capsaspora owczarzaki (strain ATCC 30864) TaxID=595528 RepID=A0A0D2VFN6_CAPO3|nr:L-threonine dehydrogenase [Capsaspora owczarzaki ATCC 30864]KJE88552.1 L-threonine dehydrogenase [Capsaspora owczarzaki ATCC 30864]|eukprot:XP_004365064.1 L-threonine dehydrogenase [Capsaspora owczarzaki ATCC 30864]
MLRSLASLARTASSATVPTCVRSLHSPAAVSLSSVVPTSTAPGKSPRILITGSLGQLGSELAKMLRAKYGKENVVTSDIRKPDVPEDGPFKYIDVLNYQQMEALIVDHRIDWVVHFSALLSAIGEQQPAKALQVNIQGFQNIVDLAKVHKLRVFCPSTIGAFGPTTPADNTPDLTIMRPTTIYGITKVHMELMGEYYHNRYGVDFRSLRYPGVISAESLPGGGTTDYAVDIFHHALKTGEYTCFLSEKTRLPMMYMHDCLKGTMMMLEAPNEQLKQRVYNLAAFSFTPEEIAEQIRKHVPLKVAYRPDFRQAIADSWPRSLDDTNARQDWQWSHDYDLKTMVGEMLTKLRRHYPAVGKQ